MGSQGPMVSMGLLGTMGPKGPPGVFDAGHTSCREGSGADPPPGDIAKFGRLTLELAVSNRLGHRGM